MTGPVRIRQRLAGGDLELAVGAAEMGAFVTCAWPEGGRCSDVSNVLHRGGSCGDTLRVRVVSHLTADWCGAGRF